MELGDFIANTLKAVIDGVTQAQEYAKQHDARINPRDQQINGKQLIRRDSSPDQMGQFVEFDVAVTASEGTEGKAGLGIMVASIGLGSQVRSDLAQSTVSRIKFNVSLFLPQQK